MINFDNFCIRERSRHHNDERKCPVCNEDVERASYYVEVYNEPLCRLCGWERAPNLSNLLRLGNADCQFHDGGPSPDVRQELEKRADDPKRLKKELEQARDVLGRRNGSILAELVTHEIEAALKRDDVDIKRNALKAFKEMDVDRYSDLDAEIPF